MENEQFLIAVRQAAYGEWNKYLQLYDPSAGLDACLQVMDPDNLAAIISRAQGRLTDVGMEAVKGIYQEYYSQLTDTDRFAIMPTVDMYNAFAESLVRNSEVIEVELNYYAMLYVQFIEKLKVVQSFGRSVSSAAIGGAIGSLLGPIGALIGGFALGSISDNKAKEELSACSDALDNAYAKLLDSVNGYLESMTDIMLSNVHSYSNRLSQ